MKIATMHAYTFGYVDFQRDPIRKRMDDVLAYFYERDKKTFEKWRVKYLRYVENKYPHIWEQVKKK